LAEAGPEDFYQGEIAAAILADVRAAGGILSAEDLARCAARIQPALEIPYRGARFGAAPGMSAGPTLGRLLGALSAERFGPSPDARYFAAVIGALQRAYAERLERVGESERGKETSTTHISAVDREGGMAALTTTLLASFGSRFVLPQTGILMNNGVMWFDPRPRRPNSMAPGKRALTNMCPLVVSRAGRPFLGIGASGGRRILPAVLQIASFIIDFGMDPETAAHHPRVDFSGGGETLIDRRLPPEVARPLAALPGARLAEHTVLPVRFACPNFVFRGEDGINTGISDVMSPSSAAAAEPERKGEGR
jgi:gamma-glutamyltranspeptidase / glutathione hydrolase